MYNLLIGFYPVHVLDVLSRFYKQIQDTAHILESHVLFQMFAFYLYNALRVYLSGFRELKLNNKMYFSKRASSLHKLALFSDSLNCRTPGSV